MTDRANDFGSYDWFVAKAEALLTPLAELMRDGDSVIPIDGPPSDHGEMADRLESVARPMLLAALWLGADRDPTRPMLDADRLATWFRSAIELGTDPASGGYWGNLSNHHQHAVEMAIIAMSLGIAGPALWEPLADDTKRRVAAWFAQIRGHAGYRNNHLFFDVLVLEFLHAIGESRPGDDEAIDHLMRQLESMHMGDGWFIDGTNETYDHYNAYAFHTYGLYWAHAFGRRDPERVARWRTWASSFLADYAHCFASSGEPAPIGRSLTYRFNGVGVFALAFLNDIDSVKPAVACELCARCIEFFTSRPIGQSQGCLSIGWTDEFQGIREPYSCAGSPYWSAKGFFMLALGRDHAFFTSPATQLPADGPFTRPIRTPGWVVRSVGGGEVEIVNAGGVCSPGAAARFGSWRWGRQAYRTGVGVLIAPKAEVTPPDLALVARTADGKEAYDRVSTIPARLDSEMAQSFFALGSKATGFHVNVESRVAWNGDWLLLAFRVTPQQPAILTFGGFAIADGSGDVSSDGVAVVSGRDGRQAVLQALDGFETIDVLKRSPDAPRQHLYTDDHAVATASTGELSEPATLVALVYAGTDEAAAAPWSVETIGDGEIRLTHATLGEWSVAGLVP